MTREERAIRCLVGKPWGATSTARHLRGRNAKRPKIRDWSDRSPDADPCYLVMLKPAPDHPAGLLCAVHKTRAVADTHAHLIGGLVVKLPYFPVIPAARG